jgi:hypothetical protein
MRISKFPALVCWTAAAGVSLGSAYLNGAQGVATVHVDYHRGLLDTYQI